MSQKFFCGLPTKIRVGDHEVILFVYISPVVHTVSTHRAKVCLAAGHGARRRNKKTSVETSDESETIPVCSVRVIRVELEKTVDGRDRAEVATVGFQPD